MIVKKFFRRISVGFTAFLTASACIGSSMPSYAAETDTAAEHEEMYFPFESADTSVPSYGSYFDTHSSDSFPECISEIKGSSFTAVSGEDISIGDYTDSEGESREDCLVWRSPEGEVKCGFDIEESGNYCIEASFCTIAEISSASELSVKIDGELPFDTASRINLERVWKNEHDISTDSRGNQIRPTQVQTERWQKCFFRDTDGLFAGPLIFHLEKGHHELTLTSERAWLAIESLTFRNQYELPEYSGIPDTQSSEEPVVFRIEAEDAAYKSAPTLSPSCDNTSYMVSPSDPVKMVCNTLGGESWKKVQQSVTWNIPKESIPHSGWYKIGIKARQDQMRGFFSNRRIYIDGKVPCRELEQVKFPYSSGWTNTSPQADGESVCIYLDAGSDHSFTMEAVSGEIGGSIRRLEETVSELNVCYRDIMMITGPSPDKYTDYYVHEKIPDLLERLERLSGGLKDVQNTIESLSEAKGSEAAAIGNLAVILDKCTEKPLRIPSYLSQIKDGISSVSAWMREYRDQPLEVDYIEFASPDAEFTDCREKFFPSLLFSIKAFIGSFFEDYTTLSDISGEDAINVWVSLGRDQAQIIKEMTESQFVQETGIPVSVNLVTGGVVEASLAGKGPDAALFLGGEFPVNLAARGLLADISQFEDYSEVTERFAENAMTPYEYNGGCYGLPVSQSFPMMFCRTDILSETGIDHPPETWTELRDILPALQRKYMSVGLVLPSANISPATETGHTFAMLMLQKGMNYYNSSLSASTFDTTEAVQSFEEWTDFYTKYSFKQTYDAFSRFRTGEYPIVIANYTFYNQLLAAAPEINGLWSFYPVPATVREDGTVSHAANSNGSGAVIFNKVKNKEGAWEFIKWFTSADTQTEFAERTEGLLGTLGRFDTANTEALRNLSWTQDELERLEAQRSELEEIPIIPASYAVTRNIMNAFRETVNGRENPRDTLIWYNRDINDEIKRKQFTVNSR